MTALRGLAQIGVIIMPLQEAEREARKKAKAAEKAAKEAAKAARVRLGRCRRRRHRCSCNLMINAAGMHLRWL